MHIRNWGFFFYTIGLLANLVLGGVQDSTAQEIPGKQHATIESVKTDLNGDFIPDHLGDTVTIAGRVTVASDVFWKDRLQIALQDATAGIFIYDRDYRGPSIQVGDSLVLRGVVVQYRGLTQIISPQLLLIDSLDRKTPMPISFPTNSFEEYEGKLVTLKGRILNKSENGGGKYLIVSLSKGSDSTLMVFNSKEHKNPTLFAHFSIGESLQITGLLSQHDFRIHPNGHYQLLPRSIKDFDVIEHTASFYLFIIGGISTLILISLLFLVVLRVKVRQRTAELRLSEQRFASLANSAPVGIFRTLPNGDTIYVNPKWTQLSGLSFKEAIGYGWLKAVHPDDRKKLEAEWKVDSNNSKQSLAEYRFVQANGNIVWVIGQAVPEYDVKGNLTGYIGSITDITKLKSTSKELKQSEDKFRSLFENHAAVKLIIDPNTGKISDANHAAASFYGWNREELTKRTIQQINHLTPEEITKNMDQVKVGLKNHFEFKHHLANDSIRDVEVFSSNINIGGKVFLHSIVQDISERKRLLNDLVEAKEKAEVADRLKSAFLENISHEIRTPLNAIVGFSEMIVEETTDMEDSAIKEYNAIITDSSEKLIRTVNMMVDISRVQVGDFTLNPLNVNVEAVIAESISELEQQAIDKTISLQVINNTQQSTLVFDKYCLKESISQLIDNAIKFTEKGGVTITLFETDDNIMQLDISDTGRGISQSFIRQIFQTFSQEEDSFSRPKDGLGLGLSLVNQLLELNGATLQVESQEGKGTTFSIIFKHC